MKKTIYFTEEIVNAVGTDKNTLQDWADIKLFKPDGTTLDDQPYYSQETIDRLRQVKNLSDLGYEISDIQKIIKKIGLPKEGESSGMKHDKPSRFLTVGELASRVGVSPRAIKHWEEKGILEADLRSQGGFRLYPESYENICRLITDLQLFGYSLEEIKILSNLFRDFLAAKENIEALPREASKLKMNEMLEQISSLFNRMNQMKEGIDRWESLLKKKKREITNLRNRIEKRESANTETSHE